MEPSEGGDLRSIAVEAIDAALERLADESPLPPFDVVSSRILATLQDGTADFPEGDVKVILAEVLATRVFRQVGSRIFRQGVFSEA